MPALSKETREYHIERVREVIAINPRASARSIRAILESNSQDPLVLDRDYIGALLKKIRAERRVRFDRKIVEERLSEIQDQTEQVVQQLWLILLDTKQSAKNRIAAANGIVSADHKFWQAQLDAGIFERKLGTIDLEIQRRNKPIPAEVKEIMINAIRQWKPIGSRPQIKANVIDIIPTATEPVAAQGSGDQGPSLG